MESKALFKVGDPVERAEPRSYCFPGIVIGANLKLDGKTWLYSVECVAPGVEGMVHEFTEKTLRHRAAEERVETYAEWQQKRGMLADKVDWAIFEYDQFMMDDAYDAQAVLDRIVKALRSTRDALSLASLKAAEQAPEAGEVVAWVYEHHEFGKSVFTHRWGSDTGGTSDDWIGWTETPLYTHSPAPPQQPEVEKLWEGLEIAEAWLDRWATHVGRCEGGPRCTCGLTRVRIDVALALRAALSDHPPAPPSEGEG